jgi:hypothetical protein
MRTARTTRTTRTTRKHAPAKLTIDQIDPTSIYPTSTLADLFGWTPGTIRSKRRSGKLEFSIDGKHVLGAEIIRYAGPAVETLKTPVTSRQAESRRERKRELADLRAAV